MMQALARLFVDAASRRWPADSGMRQEWLAEVDYLAAQHKPGRMLWFAFGLTFARPGSAPVVGFNWRTAGTALFMLLGPFAVFAASALVFNGLANVLEILDYGVQQAGLAAFAVLAGAAGWWWGRWSVVSGPFPLALGLGVSVTASMLFMWLTGGRDLVAGYAVWVPGLLVTLLLVARLAQRRRNVFVLAIGIALFLVILDVAYIAEFYHAVGDPPPSWHAADDGFAGAHAPMWFVFALTNQSFGVMSYYESFVISEDAFPHGIVLMGVFAMAYVIRAAGRNATMAKPA